MKLRLIRLMLLLLMALTGGSVAAQSPDITATHDTLEITLSDGTTGTIHHFEYIAEGADSTHDR